MEIGGFWCALLMLLLLSLDAASPGNSPAGLVCLNDFINALSCWWHGPACAPRANCSITAEKNIWLRRNYRREQGNMIKSCRMEQRDNSPPGCSVVLENQTFNKFSEIRSIRMECDGAVVESLAKYQPRSHIKMNPPGMPTVNATANHTWMSWGPGGPWSEFTATHFHAQMKRQDQQWEEAYDLVTEDLKLKVPSQQLKGLCEARVRVKPAVHPNEHWSDWSPTASWWGAAEAEGTWPKNEVSEWLLNQTRLLCCLGAAFAVILLLLAGYSRKRLFKKKPVPNPSKYFCTLQSLYEGNLKAWLNPAEAFFTTQPIDGISSVEVCDVKAPPLSSALALAPAPMQSGPSASPNTDGTSWSSASSSSSSSSSTFCTNLGYFLSHSSGSSAPAVRGPAYFTYPGHSRNTGTAVSPRCSFGSAGSSEKLEPESQSQDSGFSYGKEDEAEREELEVPEEQIYPLLLSPFQHPSAPPPLTPPPLSDGDSADGGSVCRSSSMNVQPCRAGYLTLKELHMTFSNKSI